MNLVETIGYIAMILVMVGFLPQAWQVWKTKSVDDISLLTYGLLCTAAIFWTIYGVLKDDKPLIFTNIILFCIQLSIIFCKLKYGKTDTNQIQN